MYPVSVMALFCEDIREEKQDTVTLVGVLPDAINVAMDGAPPVESGKAVRMLPKLGIYIRIKFDPDDDIGIPTARLTLPDGETVDFDSADAEVIEKARRQAKEKDNPLAGVVLRIMLASLRLQVLGMLKAEVLIHDEWHLAGVLRLNALTAGSPTSSNER